MYERASELLEKNMNFKFEESLKKILDENCIFINFPKETTVLLEGDICLNVYFIIRGIVRAYYIDNNGYDITKCFASENELFSTEGLRTNCPSTFNIECLEECECIMIPIKVIKSAMEENSDLYRLFNQYSLKAIEELEHRARDLVMKSAEERYQIFVKEYSYLSKRINQKYIASYIGIRESSLSRIKKSLKLDKLT